MRICLLSARFPPQRCGVGDYTYFLAGALARIGHDVDVLTAIGGLDELLYPLPAGVRVHRVISSWRVSGLPDLTRHIRELDPEVLFIQYTPHAFDRRGITFAVNLLPAILRIGTKTRVVTNFHEMFIRFDWALKRNAGALWQRTAALLLASASDALSVTSNEWQRRLRHLGIRKSIRMIPVGSNIPVKTLSEEERGQLRNQVLGRRDGLLIGGFGGQQHRDIPGVLYGLRGLKARGPVRLVWIGGGSPDERQRLNVREAMRSNGLDENDVYWAGVLPHPEVSRLLSACDLVILPFDDGVSTRRTSAVTALQHGLPLLTTRGTLPEPWFVHGNNVQFIPVGDRDALAGGMAELAGRPDLRARLAKGARALYKAHFDWDVIGRQVSDLGEGASSQ